MKATANRVDRHVLKYHTGVLPLALCIMVLGCNPSSETMGENVELGEATTAKGIQGHVRPVAGAPIAGLFITARAKGSTIDRTVYSASDGGFELGDMPHGQYTITLHHAQVQTATQEVTFEGRPVLISFNALPSRDARAGAPSSAWLAALPDGAMKNEFLINCATCHELTQQRIMPLGQARDKEGWAAAIHMMKAIDVYAVIPPDFDTSQYASWIAQHWSSDSIKRLSLPEPLTSSHQNGVVITEYSVPDSTELPHDLVLGPDGRIWVTAFWNGEMWAMDPATGSFEIFPVNNEPQIQAQVRALEFDSQGALWMVNGGTQAVVRLDIHSKHYDTYKVYMYAHDLVIDSHGDIWINDYFSKPERMAKVAKSNGKVDVIKLPSANLSKAAGLPLPYGLQVDAEGRLWSTQLAANTLVRYDIKSGESKLYRMPNANSGPRRTAVGVDGRIWIPEFASGKLTSFDPATERFETIDLGNAESGPYDVAVDPVSGDVWVAESLSSALVRFDPRTKSVERYNLPTEPAYMRHLAVDPKTGDVWSAYSSLPTAVPKIVRLQRKKR